MGIINKVIGVFSPRRAYERAVWEDAYRHYDAAEAGRSNWGVTNLSAENTDRASREVIRARSRDLERNSDAAEGIISAYERNVIGTGMRPQAKTRFRDGRENDKLNGDIEEVWKEWAKPQNCDVTGQQTFNEMLEMAMRRKLVDGGVFFIKCHTEDGVIPFALQAREVDELDTSLIRYGSRENRIVEGIEFNAYNRPVAYYFKRYTPDGYYTGETERIQAERVIFLWRKTRPSQIREMPAMARTINRVRDMNEYMEAVSVKERILACLSVFIKRKLPENYAGRGAKVDEKSGYPQYNIAPGMIRQLQPGEEVDVVNPSGQASNAKDLITIQQRLAGSGQGLSYEAVSRDMSMVNYSSARQGMLEDNKTYQREQQYLIEHFCREVYAEVITSAVLAGKLSIPGFWRDKESYLRHEWVLSGWSWIDPLKEVSANAKAIDCGLDTLARVCGERGLDWREVLEQRAREKEYAAELGLSGQQVQQKEGDEGDAGQTKAGDNPAAAGGNSNPGNQ